MRISSYFNHFVGVNAEVFINHEINRKISINFHRLQSYCAQNYYVGIIQSLCTGYKINSASCKLFSCELLKVATKLTF